MTLFRDRTPCFNSDLGACNTSLQAASVFTIIFRIWATMISVGVFPRSAVIASCTHGGAHTNACHTVSIILTTRWALTDRGDERNRKNKRATKVVQRTSYVCGALNFEPSMRFEKQTTPPPFLPDRETKSLTFQIPLRTPRPHKSNKGAKTQQSRTFKIRDLAHCYAP